jgi:hypothetical protein
MTEQTQTPAPPGLSLPGDASPVELQAQLQQLQATQAALQAQWNGLKGQLDKMLHGNPARAPLQQQLADVGIQNAVVEGNIAALQARIAAMQGVPTAPAATTGATSPFGIAPSLTVPAVSMLTLVLLLPLSIAWSRRILRRAPKPIAAVLPEVAMRLERIEQAVDAIAIEVERVSEAQRFVAKATAGHAGATATKHEPAGRSAMPASQPLALGAGPIEPIVMAEREQMHQRVITPH